MASARRIVIRNRIRISPADSRLQVPNRVEVYTCTTECSNESNAALVRFDERDFYFVYITHGRKDATLFILIYYSY